jgi:hypothetical protein
MGHAENERHVGRSWKVGIKLRLLILKERKHSEDPRVDEK